MEGYTGSAQEGRVKQAQGGCVGQAAPGFARWLRLGLLSILVAGGARAQEVAFALGRLHAVGEGEATYAWRMDYFQHLSPHIALSFGWLNEGHLADHHRDGWMVQAWATRDPRASACGWVGLGPMAPTTPSCRRASNDHDIRPLLTVFLAHPLEGTLDRPGSAQPHGGRPCPHDPISAPGPGPASRLLRAGHSPGRGHPSGGGAE
jgi:hypothetical protein